MRRFLLLIIILILIVSACVKDSQIFSFEEWAICFQVKTYTVETRGTPISSVSGMRDIGIFGYFTGNGNDNVWSQKGATATSGFINNLKVNNNSDVWETSYALYWPQASDANVTFFAYAPYAVSETNGIEITNTTGVPTLKYTVPSICSNQPDLMVAVPRTDLNKINNPGAVSFSMKHALVSIGFKVSGGKEAITKIAVKGISVSGTLSLDGTAIVWSNLNTASNTEYTLGIKEGFTAGYLPADAMAVDGYLMMIPQTLGPDAVLVITVNGIDKEISLSGYKWVAGEHITYNLDLDKETVIIDNLKWAVGNLIADGMGGCKIGAPEDGGLYFQFGSLVGWSGGANGDGTGRGTNLTSPALSVVVNNTGSGPAVGSTTWGDQSKWSAGTTDGETVPLAYDPCQHYLGDTWRLPTNAEILNLFENASNEMPWSGIQNWEIEGSYTVGSSNSYAVYDNGADKLKIVASGDRLGGNGSLRYVGINGYFWSNTINSSSYRYYIGFSESFVNPNGNYTSNISYGFPVRCVKPDGWKVTYNSNGGGTAPAANMIEKGNAVMLPSGSSVTAPTDKYLAGWATSSTATTATYAGGASFTPTADITLYAVWANNSVEINGINVAIGNLIADGNGSCKIGAQEDGGLYFQFGSLVGWSGGANGDGTGRGTNLTSPALSVVVNNTGSGPVVGSTTWVATAGTTYWNGVTGTVPLTRTGAVGDPCRHYLGGTWRLPTNQEFQTLFGSKTELTAWTSLADWSATGTFGSGEITSYAVYNNGTTTLKVPASGYRGGSSGDLYNVGLIGYCWSAMACSTVLGYNLNFNNNSVEPSNSTQRAFGFPVRCIKE